MSKMPQRRGANSATSADSANSAKGENGRNGKSPPLTGAVPDAAHDAALEAVLASVGRASAPPVPAGLSERLMADALDAMPHASMAGRKPGRELGQQAGAAPVPGGGPRWRDRVIDWLAGVPGLAGAAAAGLVGLWFGLAAPGPAEALGVSLQTVLWPADGGVPDWPEASGLLADDAAFRALTGGGIGEGAP